MIKIFKILYNMIKIFKILCNMIKIFKKKFDFQMSSHWRMIIISINASFETTQLLFKTFFDINNRSENILASSLMLDDSPSIPLTLIRLFPKNVS